MNSPTVTLDSITFSDGTTISLEPSDVVVVVGPNNAGKSLALRELDESSGKPADNKVVSSSASHVTGSREEFAEFLHRHTQARTEGSSWSYYGLGLSLSSGVRAEENWPGNAIAFWPVFCKRIATESRIFDSDPAEAISLRAEPINHPIHALYDNEELELRISSYFRQAFGEDLILDRAAGSRWPLYVGERPERRRGEDRLSRTYLNRFLSNAVPLRQQGDGMRSFASVVLHLLTPTSLSLLLLDEPEAFLHPPQARLLGKLIAAEKQSGAQLFLATHSPDVLQGLIEIAPEHLRILRMQRDGKVNRVIELDKTVLGELSRDPLMKYSSVMSGLFHNRVIICESDADCMFYGSILDLKEVHGETQPDVLFVHGNGKDRMVKLAGALVPLGVEVDFVVDLDVLNDLRLLRKMVETLGGEWNQIEPLAESLRKSIEAGKPGMTYSEVIRNVSTELEKAPSDHNAIRDLKTRLNKIFQQSSSWDAVKRVGKGALPSGQTTREFQELHRLCGEMGLWIVPEGELEGFCRSVDGHGPRWVQNVVEKSNIATDPELNAAREFVSEIWKSKKREAT